MLSQCVYTPTDDFLLKSTHHIICCWLSDIHLLIDLSALQPSPAKVVSHASSPAMKSGAGLTGPGFPDPGLCLKREKSAADYSPCKVAELGRTQDDSKKRKKHHPGNAIKVPEVELKLDETSGGYRLTCDRMEKRKRLGFGVPGKIPENTTSSEVSCSSCVEVGSSTNVFFGIIVVTKDLKQHQLFYCPPSFIHLSFSNYISSSVVLPLL